jgi:hypothetical protein
MKFQFDKNLKHDPIEDKFDPISKPLSEYIRLTDDLEVKFVQKK